jgi:hypothetical protein
MCQAEEWFRTAEDILLQAPLNLQPGKGVRFRPEGEWFSTLILYFSKVFLVTRWKEQIFQDAGRIKVIHTEVGFCFCVRLVSFCTGWGDQSWTAHFGIATATIWRLWGARWAKSVRWCCKRSCKWGGGGGGVRPHVAMEMACRQLIAQSSARDINIQDLPGDQH